MSEIQKKPKQKERRISKILPFEGEYSAQQVVSDLEDSLSRRDCMLYITEDAGHVVTLLIKSS